MSLPIAPTPTLKGKDAERFLAMVKEGLKHPRGPVPTPGLDQARELILNTLNEEKYHGMVFNSDTGDTHNYQVDGNS